MLKDVETLVNAKNCDKTVALALFDFLNVIAGKWRIPIIGTIMHDKLRFTDIHKLIPTITPRMLSKELKELENNGIVVRTVINTIPVTIEYSLSSSAKGLEPVIIQMVEWGIKHREVTIKKNNNSTTVTNG